MNILQLISSQGFFGAENVVLQLASELNKSQWGGNLTVGEFENSQSPNLELIERCRENGIATASFPCQGRIDFRAIFLLRKFIRKKKIDIVHSHGYKSNTYSLFASYGMAKGLVATCHNWLGNDLKMKSYARLDRFFLKRFKKVIAVSDAVKYRLLSSGVSSRKISVIRNGISLVPFEPTNSGINKKDELGISASAKVIGTVSRISEEKGHRYLLNAADEITKKYKEVIFLIVGDGPLMPALQRKYDSPQIIFTGFRKDILQLYQCMDIFVLPSLNEGLPMALLEAMASKLPVVATRVGAIPQLVKDRESGFLVEPGDQDAIKLSLVSLLNNSQLAQSMGQRGYEIVKESYSAQRMAEDYLNIYKEVI
jgi:glycosyltransferase involved in cell wall biosynthesis